MPHKDKLIAEIANRMPFIEKRHLDLLFSIAETRKVHKGEILTKPGEINMMLAFVLTGLLRSYYEKDGEEKTFLFFPEFTMAACYESIFLHKPVRQIIEVVEDGELLMMNYSHLEKIQKNDPDFLEVSNRYLQHYLAQLLQRIEMHVLESPEERYLHMIKESLDLVNRIPQKYLASYLGITPVSLSRIRARVFRRLKNEKNNSPEKD